MPEYRHPKFFSHIPKTILYDAMMGKGAVYRVGKEFILYTGDSRNLLPCGCPGMKTVKIISENGEKIWQELSCEDSSKYKGKAEEHINFQEVECSEFWNELYNAFPSLRPIRINN